MAKKCPVCGQKVQDAQPFCVFCGYELLKDQPAVTPTSVNPTPVTPKVMEDVTKPSNPAPAKPSPTMPKVDSPRDFQPKYSTDNQPKPTFNPRPTTPFGFPIATCPKCGSNDITLKNLTPSNSPVKAIFIIVGLFFLFPIISFISIFFNNFDMSLFMYFPFVFFVIFIGIFVFIARLSHSYKTVRVCQRCNHEF